jgi:glycosyltransferase involved in cell wall biosynthesis
MNKPLVSIIIPTYNRAHLIGETLDSILAQTYINWECIIVDDGSTDNSFEVIELFCKKDNRIQYHKRPNSKPKGANTCRNYGFEISKGEYVNWFDSDDVMLPEFLEVKVIGFTNNIQFVICTGDYVSDNLDYIETINLNTKTTNLFKDYVLWKLQVLTPSVLFKRSFLIDKELFLYKIKRGQEFELFSRLFFKLPYDTYRIINTPLFLYRQHESSKTFKNLIYNKDYKESQSFIAVENLKRNLEINDLALVNYFFKSLIDIFFRSIEKNHINNSKYILKNLINLFGKRREMPKNEFIILGNFFLKIKRGSYRVEKKWKSIFFE